MWIQRVDTRVRSRWFKDELSLPVLLLHGVVMAHYHRTVRIPVRGHAQPEHAEINCEREGCSPEQEQDQAEKNPPEPHPEFCRCERHDARL